MSREIVPLSRRVIDELQIVLGAMELGDYDASLAACNRINGITVKLIGEIEGIIKERHRSEIAAIEALMPRKSSPEHPATAKKK